MLIETDYRALVTASQEGLPLAAADSVIAIGNFDGVHKGHQALIASAQQIAIASGWRLCALTFNPHPRSYFNPEQPPFLLSDAVQKREYLFESGADAVVKIQFDALFSELTAVQFVEQVLIEALGVKHVIVGENFSFGKARQGTTETLRHLGIKHGFKTSTFSQVNDFFGKRIASENVRQALRMGRLFEAEELLGRPWQIRGEVVKGEQLGRNLGFPTANIQLGDYLRPPLGVYAATVTIEGENGLYKAAVNIGKRPTFGMHDPLLEAHLLDYEGDLYGKTIRVNIHDFLRNERKFSDLEILKNQLAQDVMHVREKLLA